MLDYREDTLFILPGKYSKQMTFLNAHTFNLGYQVNKNLLLSFNTINYKYIVFIIFLLIV